MVLSLCESIKTSKKESIKGANLLKRWSGRRGSNPRRPAWEDDGQLTIKNIAFLFDLVLATGQVAWTIVRGLHLRVDVASQGASDVMRDPHPFLAEILERFEDASRRHAPQLKSFPLENWSRVGQLRVGDRIAMEGPASDILWLFHFDEIHHRGQLSTYLRPMGAKVPSIYGPSGDSGLP